MSAVVLSLNESVLIERCISGLRWADEILVVDSGSNDGTQDIARQLGARVEFQPWLGWTGQHNAAAAMARYDWVFFVDADEFPDLRLQAAIRSVVDRSPSSTNGYAVDRREEYLGALLGQAQRRSKMLSRVRLYNRMESKWDPALEVHERVVFSGARILLPGTLFHWRRESLTGRLDRLMRYSSTEANLLYDQGVRASLKSLLIKPVVRFGWLIVFRGDILRGRRGLSHSISRAFGDFLRASFLLERELGVTPLHPPTYNPENHEENPIRNDI